MLKTYFRSAFRNLRRYRSFTLINIVGLSLGFAAVMVMATMLYKYLTANGQFANKGRMYYVKLRGKDGAEMTQMPYPFLYEILKSCPDVEAGTHMLGFNQPWLRAGNKEFQANSQFLDSGGLKVFSFPFEQGDPATALRTQADIVLSHELAEKFFGSAADAMGKTVMRDDTIPMKVTGVLRTIPSNTSARPEALLSAEINHANKDFMGMANWYNSFSEEYLLLRPGADTAKLDAQMNRIARAHFDRNLPYYTPFLVPYSEYVQTESGDLFGILIKAQIGAIVFILLVVVANLINLNAATLLNRQKEMAIRKMMGSGRLHLLLQFILENAMTVFVSLILAFLLFSGLLLPALNTVVRERFGAISLNIRHDYPLAGLFILAGLLIVVVAGSFPVVYFNSLQAVDAIKGKMSGNRERNTTRNIFITMQFALATTFIAITIIFNSQIRHMKGAALGFDPGNILVVNTNLAYRNPGAAVSRFDVLLNQLRQDPAVLASTNSFNIPTAYDDNFNGYIDPATSKEVGMRQERVDAGMIPTFKIKLVEGRNFSGLTDSADRKTCIINRTAATKMGWTQAVGHLLNNKGTTDVYQVVGVVEDFHFGDLSRAIDPLILFPQGKQKLWGFGWFCVSFAPGHGEEIAQQISRAFREIPTRQGFSYEYLDSRIDKQYALLEGILKGTNFVAVLTIFIAAMGLFGLIASFTRRRVKEVGIRKVLGAETGDIVGLLSRGFLVLIGIALAVATPLAYLVMHEWLQDFAYRVDIRWWMLGGAGLIALVIAAVTVGWHALRAARANPVTALRSE